MALTLLRQISSFATLRTGSLSRKWEEGRKPTAMPTHTFVGASVVLKYQNKLLFEIQKPYWHSKSTYQHVSTNA